MSSSEARGGPVGLAVVGLAVVGPAVVGLAVGPAVVGAALLVSVLGWFSRGVQPARSSAMQSGHSRTRVFDLVTNRP